MQDFFSVISKNPHSKECPTHFTREKEELRQLKPKEQLWGADVRSMSPARLTTAWLMLEDPLMIMAGSGYKSTEVRDRTFELQKEAMANLRGNRKLTKVKMGDALSSLKPTTDQTKVIALILFHLKQIQTVCFDDVEKKVWTVPEDLRAWSSERKTLWVDSRCERFLDWQESVPNFGSWVAERESEGWVIEWPVAEGSLEEMKEKMAPLGIVPKPAEVGAKVKKDDWARCVGRWEAIQHLEADADGFKC